MRGAVAILAAGVATAVAGTVPRWKTCPLPPALPTPTAQGSVAVGEASIYYLRFGDDQDPPVILLHGGMGASDHWSNQIPALLKAGMDPIAIDSRGHGRSTRTDAVPSYAAMARDVIAVMDKLKLDRAALVGWSDGGEIALHLAIANPDRVAKLIVFGANYNARGRKPRGSERSAAFRIYTEKCRADYQRLSPTPTQFDALVQWMLPIWRYASAFRNDQLRAISVPTLIVGADHDELIAFDHFKATSALIPRSKVTIIENASHFAPWQAPAEFNAIIVDFLRH